jgi:hypothetical protein
LTIPTETPPADAVDDAAGLAVADVEGLAAGELALELELVLLLLPHAATTNATATVAAIPPARNLAIVAMPI